MTTNLSEWVSLEDNPERKKTKQAIHIILKAIASEHRLHEIMILRGGVLIDLEFTSNRYTRDIDFTSTIKRKDFNENEFFEVLDDRLSQISSDELVEYGLVCRCQGYEWKPRRNDATFPALKARIGYADRMSPGQMRRLNDGQAIHVISIDYNFNEPIFNVTVSSDEEIQTIRVYTMSEIMAEKYRAILQQEMRNRYRRQDVYDLYHLIMSRSISEGEMAEILSSLVEKCASRGIVPDVYSLDNEKIRARAADNYAQLAPEIRGSLPDFDVAYSKISEFYKSLSWVR